MAATNPPRSTKIDSNPFTMISETAGSERSGVIGPKAKVLSTKKTIAKMISVHAISPSAKEKIEKAGGTVEILGQAPEAKSE